MSYTEINKIRTACPAHCGLDACGILAHVSQGRITKLEPAEFPDPKYRRICLRGLSAMELAYHPDRLRHPLRRVGERGEGKFERISWDEALDTIATRFREVADKYGWRGVGWVLGGPGTGTTKFGAYLRLASLTQSTRVSTWGYGDSALPCGSRSLLGTQVPYELLTGWDEPELIVVWGANPAEASPMRQMRRIMDLRERGTQVVVIDPRFTVTAARADDYLPVRPGTDGALALGMMHHILERGLADEGFIRKYTTGPYLVRRDNGKYLRVRDINPEGGDDYLVWDATTAQAVIPQGGNETAALKGDYTAAGIDCQPAFHLLADLVSDYPPERAAEICGLPAKLIIRLAERMATLKPVSIHTYMGFSRSFHGDLATRAIGTLSALTGNISLSAAAGHRPVMLNWAPFLKARPDKPSFERLGVLTFYDAVVSGQPFPVKAAYFANINFLNQCADSNRIIRDVFPTLDFIVSADLFLNASARYADIVLPATSFLEFNDLIYGPYPFLQLQQKVIEPLSEAKSDVAIASELAARLGYGEYFQGGEEGFIKMLLDSEHESVAGITLDKLKRGAVRTNPPPPDIGEVKLSTPSGKVEIYVETLKDLGEELPVYKEPLEAAGNVRYPLSFIQGHSRFRTHSSYGNVAGLLKMNPEPVVEMHPEDAAARHIREGDMVSVFNDRGHVTLKARLTAGVRAGVVNIMEGWWPEQFREGSINDLTHSVVNPAQSRVFEPNMAMNDAAVEIVKAEAES
jgi:molybdopterin-containing oxidoreductase family molybdopterin binding subunit